jgi:TM2 domain-containing membrane protein YozV
MRGTVVHFSTPDSKGYISGDDGNRYEFIGKEWGLSAPPQQGIRVDFGIQEDRAIKIFVEPTEVLPIRSSKSRNIAALLSFFLGTFGAQFFYLEAWGWGILSLVFCWSYIPAIIGVVLGIQWQMLSEKEFQHKIKNIKGTLEDFRDIFNTKLDRNKIAIALGIIVLLCFSTQLNKQSLEQQANNICSQKTDGLITDLDNCLEAMKKYNQALGIRFD